MVVAVQGQTKRIGHERFLAADVRVAASDTVFAQDQAPLGLHPGGGATVRLVREIGHGNAMRLMLTGEAWDVEEAQRPELARLMTTQDFREAVHAFAEQRTPAYHGR